jgi:uncharacterized protein YjbJ (UPF0337 family)
MEWKQIESDWDSLKGEVKQKWGKFTENDFTLMKGKKDELLARIKHVYGVAKEDAEKQIEEFRDSLKRDLGSSEKTSLNDTQH